MNEPGGSLPMIVRVSTPSRRSAAACSSACSLTAPQKDHENGTTMPTFTAAESMFRPVLAAPPGRSGPRGLDGGRLGPLLLQAADQIGHVGDLLLEVALVLLQPLEQLVGVRDTPAAEAVAAPARAGAGACSCAFTHPLRNGRGTRRSPRASAGARRPTGRAAPRRPR